MLLARDTKDLLLASQEKSFSLMQLLKLLKDGWISDVEFDSVPFNDLFLEFGFVANLKTLEFTT